MIYASFGAHGNQGEHGHGFSRKIPPLDFDPRDGLDPETTTGNERITGHGWVRCCDVSGGAWLRADGNAAGEGC